MNGKPLVFELSRPGHHGVDVATRGIPGLAPEAIPQSNRRRVPPRLPELSEVEVVRHYTALSLRNHGVDNGFYPLGSCTMKYNPKINEDLAALTGLAALHPWQPQETAQGALAIMAGLERSLAALTGMARFTLSPAAGAHGELTGLLLVRAYHESTGQPERRRILVPDTAHGTNPASAAIAGFEVVQVPSAADGGVDLAALRAALDDKVAALMLTNPNTLGLFETRIPEIAAAVHAAGGLVYYDGANLNAIMGLCRPAEMGFDLVHLNLHKTFSTPHGGGGPGAGPVGVVEKLVPFLPTPLVEQTPSGDYRLVDAGPLSIGRVRSFHGQFGVMIRAYAYILSLGGDGLRQAALDAVTNANYLAKKLSADYELPYAGPYMHEFVLSAARQKKHGIRALDLAKRLIDHGIHPPTIYFPLIVEEAMMVEPTETESLAVLDEFAAVMRELAAETVENPAVIHEAPHNTPVGRLDEAAAARRPVLRWRPE